jgi:hypothetical protein
MDIDARHASSVAVEATNDAYSRTFPRIISIHQEEHMKTLWAALLMTALVAVAPFAWGQDSTSTDKSAGEKVKSATKTAAKDTEKGTKTAAKDTEKGAKVAAKDTEKGAKAVGKGTEKAADKTGNTVKKGFKKVEGKKDDKPADTSDQKPASN